MSAEWPTPNVIGWFIGIFLGIVAGAPLSYILLAGEWRPAKGVCVFIISITVAVSWVFIFWAQTDGVYLAVQQVPRSTALVSRDGRTVYAVYRSHTSMWSWDKRLKNGNRLVSYDIKTEQVAMALHPITTNPKVRDLNYSVQLQFDGTEEGFRSLCLDHGCDNMNQIVEFHCYEFNEHHSKLLANFYNPRDERQQTEFKRMVNDYLSAHLPKYIVVRDVRFSIGPTPPTPGR